METFLGNVARYLYGRYGDGISSLRIVLPNSRSRLFLQEEFSALIDKPVWEPRYVTVDGLMREVSGLEPVDRVRAVVELYKIYASVHKESFDSFYFWGETLLNDFDQVDKYMVDADMLFSNLRDLRAMDGGTDYFTEDQRAVVRRFWEAFGDDDSGSDEKRSFLAIWQSLAGIYHSFRERLRSMGMAYTGMMHREAAAKLRSGEAEVPDEGPVAVVGFNALTECEKVLLDHLRNRGALFFWDYDDYYRRDRHQEAGLFIRDNVVRYPEPEAFVDGKANFCRPKELRAVSVPSGVLQCKYAAEFLKGTALRQGGRIDKETAVVLTDESLLVPLLYSVPPEIEKVNITMGYPLRQTLVYSFTERLLKLQTRIRRRNGEAMFYHADVTGILTHPFVMERDPRNAAEIDADIRTYSRVFVRESVFRRGTVLERIFRPAEGWREMAERVLEVLSEVTAQAPAEGDGRFRIEYAVTIADTLRKLTNSLDDCGVEMDIQVFSSLARRVLQNVRIPYEGEPLRGVQIMGILETRNLDFENVVILSMNDDGFPGNPAVGAASFIPYGLRYGYGLPTPQHHDGVYAYYFYRLLQRARRVDMVYSSSSDENGTGEPSRYIHQLAYESPHEVLRDEMALDASLAVTEPIEVTKNGKVVAELERYLDGGGRTISPTALNTYLACPLKFYFNYIAGMRPEAEVSEEVDASMFGSMIHRAMELLYTPLVGMADPGAAISALRQGGAVEAAVDRAVGEVCFPGDERAGEEMEGGVLLYRDIAVRYIRGNILPFDARLRDMTIIALEHKLSAAFAFVAADGKERTVTFSGAADRVDSLPGGRIRIVDYKTGSPHVDFAGVDALFGGDASERNPAVLQTLLYSMIVRRMQEKGELPGREVCPSLYYVRLMNKPDFSPLINIRDGESVTEYGPCGEEFEARLESVLAEIFDPARPFAQTDNTKACGYCDFARVCMR